MKRIKQFDTLSTSYVSLAALLRYLREQNFSGSIHLLVDQYEAEIFLVGSGSETVFEFDRASGIPAQNEGALERMMVQARAPGGTVTVHEGQTEPSETIESIPAISSLADQRGPAGAAPEQPDDWDELLRLSGDVIAAVERAAVSVGVDFGANLRGACIAVGDDYPFLDPTASGFKYSMGVVTLDTQPGRSAYVAGLSECLSRLVSKLPMAQEGERFRERVAAELTAVARLRPDGLGEFRLDRIVGRRT